MSEQPYAVGAIISADITIPNAGEVREFYQQVVGWSAEEVPMEDEVGAYADYIMKDQAGNPVTGVCHRRGTNSDLPPQWILYVNVANPEESIRKCVQLGGRVLKEQRDEAGTLFYALVQDPAGAAIALMHIG